MATVKTIDLATGFQSPAAGSVTTQRPAPDADRRSSGRPVAHWVLMPAPGGHARLEMVWEVPPARNSF